LWEEAAEESTCVSLLLPIFINSNASSYQVEQVQRHVGLEEHSFDDASVRHYTFQRFLLLYSLDYKRYYQQLVKNILGVILWNPLHQLIVP
jgi:hypothetical protein